MTGRSDAVQHLVADDTEGFYQRDRYVIPLICLDAEDLADVLKRVLRAIPVCTVGVSVLSRKTSVGGTHLVLNWR